jgi:hypothetical protein
VSANDADSLVDGSLGGGGANARVLQPSFSKCHCPWQGLMLIPNQWLLCNFPQESSLNSNLVLKLKSVSFWLTLLKLEAING